MRIGLFVGALALMRDVAERLHRISDAERDGFDSYWLPQHFGAAMLTVIAMAGMQTHRIELGTAVVPTYPPPSGRSGAAGPDHAGGRRWAAHPGDRRFPPLHHRGLAGPSLRPSGPSHRGISFRPAPPAAGEWGGLSGMGVPSHGRAAETGCRHVSCPVVMAALEPQMLEIAGLLTDGAVTWMTGPNTLRDHVVPRLQEP